jgi:spore coat polysaccharide biosynthesis protein SpsF
MAVAILQARMSSSRLPGKVMRPLAGAPMIARQIERLRRAASLSRIVVATSDEASDQPLADYLQGAGVEVFRGSLTDVLGRFAACAERFDLRGPLVRLTADCPLADPELVDACVALHLSEGADFTSNDQHRTFPRGLDVEVFNREGLDEAAGEARDPYDREHVTPFFYRNPERFRLAELTQARDDSSLRWTVDTPQDFAYVERVYAALYNAKPDFTSDDVRALPFSHHEADQEHP